MKRFSWVVIILLVTSMCLGFVGCKEPPIEPTVDKTPPAEVTLFSVTIENGSASLSWVNPSDTDFAGVQISMIPAEGILVNPISLGKDATSFTVPGLEVDCTYRFTIKTFDNSQNYSKGATQIITIENNNPSQGDDSPGDSGNDNPSGGGPSGSTDTTAPAQVSNLSAVYDAQTLQIAISWTNPQDTDFAGTVLEYGKTSSTEKTMLTFDKSYYSTVIQGIAADDSEYVVSVKTKDTTGNLSQVTSITVIAVNDVIKSFSVGDILFTDGTRIKAEDVQYGIPDEQISKAFGVIVSTSYDGGVGKAVGLQKGTSLQWAPSETTGYNTKFTEILGTTTSGDMDGSDNWDYICSVDPTGSANAATNYPAFNFANTYGQTVGLTGTDYEDGWYLPAMAELKSVYDNRHIVAESLSAVGVVETLGSSHYWSSSQYASKYNYAYELDFSDGSVDNFYKYNNYNVLVLQAFNCEQFNDYEIENAGTSIKSVKIASAGEGYIGELLVTITGTSLKNKAITCSDESFDNLTYLSNTVATATIDCTGVVGTKSVTFYCGNSIVTETAKVLSSSNCLTDSDIGKIVLSDGTFVAKEDFNSSMTPIAVVVGIKNNGGQAVAVGLQRGTNLMWAPRGTIGYNKNFTEIQGTPTGGDMDGSDNWAEVCKADPNATVYPATNYPAFNFANTYGITAGLTDTDYKNGWYVPSIAELDAVYDNKSTIQESLDVIGGFTISTNKYWSSSQYASYHDEAYVLSFSNGNVYEYYKDSDLRVLVVQAFNAQ